MRRVCERWIPKLLNDEQKRLPVECCEHIWIGMKVKGAISWKGFLSLLSFTKGRFTYTRNKVLMYDVENSKLSIAKETLGKHIHQEADVCGLFWRKRDDPSSYRFSWADKRHSLLHEVVFTNVRPNTIFIAGTSAYEAHLQHAYNFLSFSSFETRPPTGNDWKRPISYHDNVPSHWTIPTQLAIQKLGFELLERSLYSPDILYYALSSFTSLRVISGGYVLAT